MGSRMLGTHVDFEDEDTKYVLRADLPGFEPTDFDVKISGNVLTPARHLCHLQQRERHRQFKP